MARGGYRKPNKPAPVSGPGAMSRRTDGGPEDQAAARWIPQDEYGAATELMDIQRSAPMKDTRKVVPLDAPTDRPSEPITAGAPFGPGPGPSPRAEAPPETQQQPRDDVSLIIRAAYAAHPSPELGSLMSWLEARGR